MTFRSIITNTQYLIAKKTVCRVETIGSIFPTYGLEAEYVKVKFYVGVSKNRGTPKWMVYNGKPY